MDVDEFDIKKLRKDFKDKPRVPLLIINACYSGLIGESLAHSTDQFEGPNSVISISAAE